MVPYSAIYGYHTTKLTERLYNNKFVHIAGLARPCLGFDSGLV